jgi:hypothetical protein
MSNAANSPRAYALYRQLVAEANEKPIRLCQDTDLTDAELWWCELSPLESWVFGIEPSLLNALVMGYVRYQDMIGCTDVEFSAFREEDRAAFPKCFQGELVFSLECAVGFMMDACELPFEQSLMWVCRALVQNVRSGLYEGPKEAPAWAHGEVSPEGLFNDPDSWKLESARGFW